MQRLTKRNIKVINHDTGQQIDFPTFGKEAGEDAYNQVSNQLTSLQAQLESSIASMSEAIVTDKTLTIEDAPADAKATGDAINNLRGAVGSPLVAATAASMTNTNKVYVYTGSETGYTNGNWYYHDGTSWVSGGVYNSVAVDLDSTLTLANKAPDSKVVGDAIGSLNEDITNLQTDKQDVLTFDQTPTAESTNPVTSAGIKTALDSVDTEIGELKENLSYYTEEDIPVNASPEGWRLTGTGACTEATSYKLVKYLVTAGDLLRLTLSKDVTGSEAEGVYQWQNVAGVPSNLPNTNLIGTPVTEAIDGYVEVPTGATYLIVSQFKMNTTNKVMLVTGVETVKEKIEGLNSDVDELNEKVDGIEPGLSSEAKAALLACIEHVKWSDDNGQSYYDDLYNALYGVQPDPEVPNAYTRYDWIRLKQYSEAPNVYTEGSANMINVGIYDGYNPMISTSPYSDLNQLNFKATIGIMPPPASLTGSPNSCAFGGGLSDDAASRFGTYWHTSKQWIYCMMHGVERQIQQELQDVNTLEIINNSSSPSTVKINGTAHSFVWTNSNVLNNPIAYFANKNFSLNPSMKYFSGVGTYTKVGEIEISTQGGELISKLIPVIRKADSVIGIWDSVRKEFYTPALSKYATIGNTSCIYAVGNWE